MRGINNRQARSQAIKKERAQILKERLRRSGDTSTAHSKGRKKGSWLRTVAAYAVLVLVLNLITAQALHGFLGAMVVTDPGAMAQRQGMQAASEVGFNLRHTQMQTQSATQHASTAATTHINHVEQMLRFAQQYGETIKLVYEAVRAREFNTQIFTGIFQGGQVNIQKIQEFELVLQRAGVGPCSSTTPPTAQPTTAAATFQNGLPNLSSLQANKASANQTANNETPEPCLDLGLGELTEYAGIATNIKKVVDIMQGKGNKRDLPTALRALYGATSKLEGSGQAATLKTLASNAMVGMAEDSKTLEDLWEELKTVAGQLNSANLSPYEREQAAHRLQLLQSQIQVLQLKQDRQKQMAEMAHLLSQASEMQRQVDLNEHNRLANIGSQNLANNTSLMQRVNAATRDQGGTRANGQWSGDNPW